MVELLVRVSECPGKAVTPLLRTDLVGALSLARQNQRRLLEPILVVVEVIAADLAASRCKLLVLMWLVIRVADVDELLEGCLTLALDRANNLLLGQEVAARRLERAEAELAVVERQAS